MQARLAEDLHQSRHVLQILRRGVVQFRHDQQVAGVRTILVDGGHGRLHGQGQHFRGQIVKTAREQIGIDGRQLVAGVAQVYRAIKGRRMLLPLHAKPALNGRRRGQNLFFEVEQRSGQGRDEMGNHSYILKLCAVIEKHTDCRLYYRVSTPNRGKSLVLKTFYIRITKKRRLDEAPFQAKQRWHATPGGAACQKINT
ncbi:hypothetical protein D3C72_1665110 [compost metagenome]